MGNGTKENPYTREDVLKLIEQNGGTSRGLDLTGKVFQGGIDLRELDLMGIILNRTIFQPRIVEISSWKAMGGGVQLQGTNLFDAQLQDAELGAASMERAILRGANLQRANLTIANLRQANLEYTQLQDIVLSEANLQGANLNKARLEGANLYRAKFSPDTKLEDADWGNYILGEEKDRLFTWAIADYRQLKVWYINAGISDIAAIFYYREREATRKSLKWFSKYWHHRLALQLSYWVFGHGERWRRLLFWIAGFILVFALIYFAIGTLRPNTFLSSLYYSAVSFISLGYGSWVKEATGWVKGLGVLEAFLGFFMMTLLLVTFVRKWTR